MIGLPWWDGTQWTETTPHPHLPVTDLRSDITLSVPHPLVSTLERVQRNLLGSHTVLLGLGAPQKDVTDFKSRQYVLA